MTIQIETGNPFEERNLPDDNLKPASYTRFILPFAYIKVDWKCADSSLLYWQKWEPIDDAEWRQQYFTQETSEVLFKGARWFRLHQRVAEKPNGETHDSLFSRSFNLALKEGCTKTKMRAPVLVLFEYPQEQLKARDLLHTGFLIIELYFDAANKGTSLDSLLLLNERFRYKEKAYDGHDDEIHKLFPQGLKNLYPEQELEIGKSLFDYWQYLLRQPLRDDTTNYFHLIGEENCTQSERPKCERAGWDVYADNRTLVWTCAVIKGGGKTLRQQQYVSTDPTEPWESHNYGHWIKLLNVDAPGGTPAATHGSRKFEREWAEQRTYHRWEECGTFYGFSYHSGALLCPPSNEPNGVPLWRHFGTMYFDMFLLLLYVRVSLFRFSTQLTEISTGARGQGNDNIEQWAEKFETLRWQFTLFTNLYQFPLISNQQQGLELYDLARECLDVDALYKEIQSEVQSSHDFLLQKQQQRQSETTTRLTMVATIGLALSIVLAFLSTDFGKQKANLLAQLVFRSESMNWRALSWLTGSGLALFFLVSQSMYLSRWIRLKFPAVKNSACAVLGDGRNLCGFTFDRHSLFPWMKPFESSWLKRRALRLNETK